MGKITEEIEYIIAGSADVCRYVFEADGIRDLWKAKFKEKTMHSDCTLDGVEK